MFLERLEHLSIIASESERIGECWNHFVRDRASEEQRYEEASPITQNKIRYLINNSISQ